jgi:hypothetical protein
MPVFCTVVTRSYLAYARVLTQSLRKHHPEARVVVLIVDETQGSAGTEEFEIVVPQELGVDRARLHEMASIYDARELCTALEPALCLHLLRRSEDPVVYLDADSRVFSRLDGVDELARKHSLVLSSHWLHPVSYLDRRGRALPIYDDSILLAYGQFNAGFFAVTHEALPFLAWWDGWLLHHCVHQLDQYLSGNQRWLDCVPSLFQHYVLRQPGFNVAYWNLHERSLSKEAGRYLCDGEPLRLFHFSKFDPSRPDVLAPGVVVAGLVGELCRDYSKSLHEQGYKEVASIPYGFSTTRSGLRLDARMSRLVRDALLADPKEDVPDPFNSEQAQRFTEWLRGPSRTLHGLSRYLADVYESRLDVRTHFPDLEQDSDLQGFLRWTHRFGVHEERIPQVLLPAIEADGRVLPEQLGDPQDEDQGLRKQIAALQGGILQLRSSKSFRYTAALRSVWGAVRRTRMGPHG